MDRNGYVYGEMCAEHWVATREGGVDRNTGIFCIRAGITVSPPARVAWIETVVKFPNQRYASVATREGGVDRNVL